MIVLLTSRRQDSDDNNLFFHVAQQQLRDFETIQLAVQTDCAYEERNDLDPATVAMSWI